MRQNVESVQSSRSRPLCCSSRGCLFCKWLLSQRDGRSQSLCSGLMWVHRETLNPDWHTAALRWAADPHRGDASFSSGRVCTVVLMLLLLTCCHSLNFSSSDLSYSLHECDIHNLTISICCIEYAAVVYLKSIKVSKRQLSVQEVQAPCFPLFNVQHNKGKCYGILQ